MNRVEISFNTIKRTIKSEFLDEGENEYEIEKQTNIPKIKNISNTFTNKSVNLEMNKLLTKSSLLNRNELTDSIESNNSSFNDINSNPLIKEIYQNSLTIQYFNNIIKMKFNEINELNTKINDEINKIIICRPCMRKFANIRHLMRHTTLSELHKLKIASIINK